MDKRHKKLQMKYREVCRSLQQGRERENSMACEFGESREKLEAADKTITELQTLLSDIIATDVSTIEAKNEDLKVAMKEMEKAPFLPPCSSNEQEFTIKTKDGTSYSNSIHELYYTLMTTGIAPNQIDGVIRTVLLKLCPSIDITSLKLPPQKLCKLYEDGRNANCQRCSQSNQPRHLKHRAHEL